MKTFSNWTSVALFLFTTILLMKSIRQKDEETRLLYEQNLSLLRMTNMLVEELKCQNGGQLSPPDTVFLCDTAFVYVLE